MRTGHLIWISILILSLAGCSDEAKLPVSAGTGPNPELPPPADRLIPTVNIAPARGWPAGGKPTAAEGTAVNAFADNLDHPRWLYVLTGFLSADEKAPGRPVGVVLDKQGALLVADDVGNIIWRVAASPHHRPYGVIFFP